MISTNPAPASIWNRITPRPNSRSLICGSVGSGKSTLGCTLLESYRSAHPLHPIYIVDPKKRFFPVDPEKYGPRLFPRGAAATNHGKTDGVSVCAYLLRDEDGYNKPHDRTFLIQSHAKSLEFFSHIFEAADVRRPTLLYMDETHDYFRGGRADYRLRRIIQMGRERGIGVILINQLLRFIDTTFVSESERIFVGTLHHINDRKRLAETVAIPEPKRLLVPMDARIFWMIDQATPANSLKFTVKV